MIHIVIGTRAQLLKMAPIMKTLDRHNIKWRWIYTAQHKETMSQLISDFSIKKPDLTLFQWDTEAKTIKKMVFWIIKVIFCLIFESKKILSNYSGPENIVLTHGDTITAWWGAVLGKLNGCKVMHVESGLRSYNLLEPFPEEINRLITFCLSDIYACPGDWAIDNLKFFKGDKINTIYNTQIETLYYGLNNLSKSKFQLPENKFAIVSIHRYENIFKSDQLKKIMDLIIGISEKIQIYFVLHPSTAKKIEEAHMKEELDKCLNIKTIPRLDHLSFIKMINACEFVITDGGGNQEELSHLGKPCLLFRSYTERQEGLGSNTVLSQFNKKIIDNFVSNYKSYRRKRTVLEVSPSETIVNYLIAHDFIR